MRLYLREDCQADLATIAPGFARVSSGSGQPPVHRAQVRAIHRALAQADGTLYRQAAHRRTTRVAANGGVYFTKLHYGVGWREIVKNLLALKRPVLGARNEFVACQRLRACGVAAPRVAAFGVCGRNPARQRSFLVCNALTGMASVEGLAGEATPLMRRRLVVATGTLLRAMHGAGVYHRDCYLTHVFADIAQWKSGHVALAVIDLHRAWVRQRLPHRWRRRDLAALLFSARPFRLTRSELLRFAAAYAGEARTWRRERRFWRGVLRRERQLRRRSMRRGRPATGLADASFAASAPSVTDFHDLDAEPAVPFRFDVDFDSGPARALCARVLCWRAQRGFTAHAMVKGDERLLSVFFGRGRARRFRRVRRIAQRLAAAGVGPSTLAAGQCVGARVLACPPLAGRRPATGDLPALLRTLARLHEQSLRPLDMPAAQFRLRCGHARIAPWQIGWLRPPRRQAIERDVALLLGRFGTGSSVAEALRLYEQARRWSNGRLRYRRVRDHLARLGASGPDNVLNAKPVGGRNCLIP